MTPAAAAVAGALGLLPDVRAAAVEAARRLVAATGADVAVLLLEGWIDAPAAIRRGLPEGATEAARRRLAERLAAEGVRLETGVEATVVDLALDDAEGTSWEVFAPVRREGRTIGGWLLEGRGDLAAPRAAAEEAAGVAAALAHVAAAAAEAGATLGRIEAIGAVGDVIRAAEDLDRTLARLLEIALHLAGAEVGAIALAGENGTVGPARITWGLDETIVADLVRRDGRGVVEAVVAEDAPFVAPDAAAADLDLSRLRLRPTSIAVFPLSFEGERLGALLLAQAPPEHLGPAGVAAVSTVCALAAAALAAARRAQERRRTEHLEREVALAREIQLRLLPRDLPEIPGFTVAGATEPALEVGGDYYDVFPLGRGRFGLVVADVSGKGIPAAILMTGLRAYLRVRAAAAASTAEVVGALNRHLAEDVAEDRFATLVYAVLDAAGGEVEVSSAGHLPPLIVRAGGAVEAVEGGGAPLGIDPGETYPTARLRLGARDRLILYSDGLVEAPAQGGRYGEARLRRAAVAAPAGAAATLAAIRADLAAVAVAGGRDDLTLLVLSAG